MYSSTLEIEVIGMSVLKHRIGEQIRNIRKRRGMTQEALADRSGLSFSYISDVERGTRNISLDSLGRIVEALGTTPAQMFADMNELLVKTESDAARGKLETLQALLMNRSATEVDFIISVAKEFIRTVDQKQ